MDRDSNIFFNITQENEDTSTDLLCNILRTKYIRDITLDFIGISKKSLDTITLEHIFTRKGIDGVGIPDITIENDDTFFFIENKIHVNTDLQDSQITTYPDFIYNKKYKVYKGYIFLIPKNYEHEIEINESMKKYPFITKIYWEDLLKYLYKLEIQNESPVISEVLNFLNYLVSNEFVLETKLNISEVVMLYNPKDIYSALSLVYKINRLADIAAEKIVEKFGQDFCIDRTQRDLKGQGIYLKYNNKPAIFIGLNPFLYEEQNGDFVLSVALYRKTLKENININDYYSDDEGWLYIKMDRKRFTEEDQENLYVKDVVDIIENIFLKNI